MAEPVAVAEGLAAVEAPALEVELVAAQPVQAAQLVVVQPAGVVQSAGVARPAMVVKADRGQVQQQAAPTVPAQRERALQELRAKVMPVVQQRLRRVAVVTADTAVTG